MLGFLIGAVIGAVLLTLPISLKQGVMIDFVDALFVAVSSICVTGLSTINIGQTFSVFGQVVLLLLIQMGGLGVVTFTTMGLILFHKRITLTERLLIQSAYNLETLSGLVRLTKRILTVTLCIEGIGAIGYATVFLPEYGIPGIWYSIFHAVSAFCNAGIDLLGQNSFGIYRDHVMLNVVTMSLIVVSGLGFPVYWEIFRVYSEKRKTGKKIRKKLNIQTRIVLSSTFFLLGAGFLLTLLFEAHNPDTLGALGWPQKCMAAFFQSVTLRTAGFSTIDQGLFKEASCLVYAVLMFIGGSPAGTAGGVKTVTVTLLLASMWANIRGRKDVTLFGRKIPDEYIRRCVAIVVFSFSTMLVLLVALLAVQNCDFLDGLYEMVSAIGTVGLSRGLTSDLTLAGKLIVILAMYLGRIGPITLAMAFNSNRRTSEVSYAESRITVG